MEHWPCPVASRAVSLASGFGVIRLVFSSRILVIDSSLIGRKVIALMVSNSV